MIIKYTRRLFQLETLSDFDEESRTLFLIKKKISHTGRRRTDTY